MNDQVYPTVDPAELEPEYSEHKRAIEAVAQNGDGWVTKGIAFAATQLALRDREIARLARELESLDAVAKFTAEERDELESRVVHFRKVCAKLEPERDTALARVRELEGELAIEQDGHTETARSLSALESRIRELTESNARLLADLGNASARIQELQETRTMGMKRGCVVNPNRVLAEQVVRIELSLESPSGDAEHVYKTLMAVTAGRKNG